MTYPSSHSPHARSARGFTLVEIVVVLFILAIVIGMAAAITSALSATQRSSLTSTRMAGIDAAIVQFVMQQKRLPCPANGTLPSGDNNAGVEMRAAAGCTNSEQNGVVPWRTLGLTEADATDGWGRRMTYRTQPTLGADGGPLDMFWCDPAKTATGGVAAICAAGCTTATIAACTAPSDFLLTKGLEVRNIANIVLMSPAATPPTGAAYVVVSHGKTGGGAYLNTGTLATSTVVDGTQEAKNYASASYVAGVTYYVDDALNETSGAATHFDDVVSRPALLTVINKAGLGPRSH